MIRDVSHIVEYYPKSNLTSRDGVSSQVAVAGGIECSAGMSTIIGDVSNEPQRSWIERSNVLSDSPELGGLRDIIGGRTVSKRDQTGVFWCDCEARVGVPTVSTQADLPVGVFSATCILICRGD